MIITHGTLLGLFETMKIDFRDSKLKLGLQFKLLLPNSLMAKTFSKFKPSTSPTDVLRNLKTLKIDFLNFILDKMIFRLETSYLIFKDLTNFILQEGF